MKKIHILSALVPMVIFGVVLGIMNIVPFNPFGDRQILIVDAWHQYYPFISELWHKLRGGGSMLWSWAGGGGHDYLAQIGYYLASPFNFLTVLFPHAWLREVITVFVVVRVGLAGLFMSIYLRHISKRPDMMIVAFSAAYALCAWMISFYWNFMWIDTFVMLPFVMLGLLKFVNEGKFKLLIISLALSIIFNFYIGFFICIFVAIMFFVLAANHKMDLRTFFIRLGVIGICSIVAIGMTAFLTLPTFSALQYTGRIDAPMPGLSFNHSFVDLIGNFVTLMPTARAVHGGFPNIYAGILVVMLYPLYLISRVPTREKIAFSLAVVFVLISTNVPLLNFMWHGFSATHGLPYRYSFIISFLMITMAYRAYCTWKMAEDDPDQIKNVTKVVAVLAGAVLFIGLAYLGVHYVVHVHIVAGFALIYIILLGVKGICMRFRRYTPIVIAAVMVAELSIATFVGLAQGGATTGRDHFPLRHDDVQAVLAHRQVPENTFYRTDFTARWSTNDTTKYGVEGISFFSSMANQNTIRFMNGIGLINWAAANSYAFAETSPLTGAMLNIRYLVNRTGTVADDGVFWDTVAYQDGVALMRNNRHLPLGFVVNHAIESYESNQENPFDSQNNFFRLATGLDGDIFTLLDVVHVGHENLNVWGTSHQHWNFNMQDYSENAIFRFNYLMPRDAEVYAYTRITNTSDIGVTIGYAEVPVRRITTVHTAPHMYRVATFREGDMFTLYTSTEARSGTATTLVGILDRELFDQGFDQMAERGWVLTSFRDTRMSGVVYAGEGGVMFTSIPYTGNWRARVNGAPVEVIAIDGGMSAVRLPAGIHEVEFYYRNNSFVFGSLISLGSLMIFAGAVVLEKRGVLYGKI